MVTIGIMRQEDQGKAELSIYTVCLDFRNFNRSSASLIINFVDGAIILQTYLHSSSFLHLSVGATAFASYTANLLSCDVHDKFCFNFLNFHSSLVTIVHV